MSIAAALPGMALIPLLRARHAPERAMIVEA
jgi:hypothetical protein